MEGSCRVTADIVVCVVCLCPVPVVPDGRCNSTDAYRT